MITSFVYDGHEIEVQNGIATANLVIDGQQFDSVKGVFKPEKQNAVGNLRTYACYLHKLGSRPVCGRGFQLFKLNLPRSYLICRIKYVFCAEAAS